MMDKEQEFMEHLRATFRVEADEHLQRLSSGLIDMEKVDLPERRKEIIEELFREVHSLKGAARSVRFAGIERFCQALEGRFAALKHDEIELSPELFDLLHRSADFLCQLLSTADGEPSADNGVLHQELMERLEWTFRETGKQGNGETGTRDDTPPIPRFPDSPIQDETPSRRITHVSEPRVPGPGMVETVRVSTAKLSTALLRSEEMLSAKLATGQRVAQLREGRGAFLAWKKEWLRIAPDVRNCTSYLNRMKSGGASADTAPEHELTRILEFLAWNGTFMAALEGRYAAEMKSAKHDSVSLGVMVNNLLDDMKNLMMFPFSTLLQAFPKIVRDLSRDYGKDAELVVRGGEIEIDRRIMEEMKDPLVHLVRNCIDHGIGKPEERSASNKPERGTITVAISPRDDKVEVIVADDGAGIPLDRVRSAVLKLGLVPEEGAGLTDGELLPYVFQSGVSTSPIITELSGRGLGLAIVREKVEKLGGSVSVSTDPGAGTSFRMVIPLKVATFRGILVRVGERTFIIPTIHVERVLRMKPEEILTVENRATIRMNDQAVSLARLTDTLELPPGKKEPEDADFMTAIVLSSAGTIIAFVLDEVLGEQEVLMKHLGRQLSRVRNVSGAAVLGSGRLVPILNVPDLLKSAVRLSGAAFPSGAAVATGGGDTRRRSVMVVEDSITTRTLLQNILEAVGYAVVTAVDGVDAFTKLKGGEFDIVVSDVEMPRMNGFDLTTRIRADKELGELPVVLVTALESREDRERGIDVGANAYIVKSSFDQSNLLEVIRRLV